MSSTRSLYTALMVLILAGAACSTHPEGLFIPTVTKAATTPVAAIVAETETPAPPTATSQPTEPPAAQAKFPDPQQYQWREIVTGLHSPIAIANAGDGSGRLFVVEKAGVIRIVQNDKLLDQLFLDIKDRVGANSSERGLLGLAFHPNYKENGYFYVNYTDKNGNSVVSRFHATDNVADLASEKKLLGAQQPYPNHNGGSVVFGPDGYLYLGFGDGGSAGDPHGNGQSLTTFLGKILRIDVDSGDPYIVPIDNPFMSGNVTHEIWAYGLRNPWRFSFDSANGDLYIGDVGQNLWEEIDFLPAGSPSGANFGWNVMEASHSFAGSDSPSFVAPVVEYAHGGDGCSVTGGYVYRGAALSDWTGIYFYSDYCSGKIWGLHQVNGEWESRELFQTGANVSSFGLDENGEIYFAGYQGDIFRLEAK